ncbi:phage late control D family protein, partial [Ralstonia solanacearum]|nr:phage late control D family protein [Ralstonia solanacearum]
MTVEMLTGDAEPKPVYRLKVGDKDITDRFQDRLIGLTLTDNPGFEADQLDIELDDSDGLLELP